MVPPCSVLLLAALIGLAGCAEKTDQLLQLETENRQLQRQLRQVQQQLSEKQDTLSQRDQQISELLKLGPQRVEALFQVERITLGRYTGGTNLDDKPGHDGVRVYLIPQDDAGRTVTASGNIDIDVFDLALKDQPLLMSYSFSPDQAKEHWRSGSLANHYNITCSWKDTLPSGNELTIRVTFGDYLTGRTFTATKQCTIRNPRPQQQPPLESD